MNLYNTLTKKIELLKPHEEGKIKMYTCGPTVYHYAHIGNLRCYIMEDILEKTLEYLGYQVERVMNITDVGHLSSDSDSGEDKMLKGAKREHKSVLEIANFYTDTFLEDCRKLNIRIPKTLEKATNHIDYYIHIITELLEKGYAYLSNGNIYFDTTKLNDYYKLTNHKEDSMVVGVRESVEMDESKKNQADFVLWFTKSKFDDQELKWDSPWGVGYPGWHIECSGISLKYLGEYLDIHCGGIDNIFPHHTNEIAQSEAFLGHSWCKSWFHVEHLNDATGKMSKSKGEFLTIQGLEEKGYSPIVYRFFCLHSHYRKTLQFSYSHLEESKNTYDKLKRKIFNLRKEGEINQEQLLNYQEKFKDYLKDDLNTANAITVLYEVINHDDMNGATKLSFIEEIDNVLSLDLLKEEKKKLDQEFISYIETKIEERNIAKKEKNFLLADQIRDELEAKKIYIKDTREGTIFEVR